MTNMRPIQIFPLKREKKFWGTTWKKFILTIHERQLISKGERVLAMVSGGPDSTAMACWLKLLSNRLSFELTIAHFDHGLRPDSPRDLEWVKDFAHRLEVPFYSEILPLPQLLARQRRSIEEAARFLRYQAAWRASRKLKMTRVASAHTLDEQAESVLLNIIRGQSILGLAGARITRPIVQGSPITLIRPMLKIKKAEAMTYLQSQGIRYLKDPMNEDPRFLRNRIRRELIPKLLDLNPRVLEHLSGLGEKLGLK